MICCTCRFVNGIGDIVKDKLKISGSLVPSVAVVSQFSARGL